MPPKNAWSPAPPDSAGRAARLGYWLLEQRWLIATFLAALVVRLHWNLEVHKLGDYIYSDMNGYVARADRMLTAPFEPHEYSAFFPPATHWLVAACKYLFGNDNYDAVGIIYAFFGAGGVAMAYAVARRVSRFAFVAPAVGLFGIVYYPLLSLGGYILSEAPFSFFMMGALLSVVRLADDGRKRDAWAMGFFAGAGALFRPQLLLSAGVIGLYWIMRRRSLPNIRFTLLLQSAIPLLVFLGISATHLHFQTGRYGLVTENGSFNLVFGRCHNSKIESLPDGQGHGKVHFRPPPFLQVNNLLDKAKREHTQPPILLDPAIHDELSYKGYIGDRKIHMEFIKECLQRTGVAKQLSYSWTNASLLWLHNIPWPDSGRGAWRNPATWWTEQHRYYLAIPALIGLLWMFVPGQRGAKWGLVAANLFALVLLAAIFFGGARHRAPYDLVIIMLAFETYATAGWLLYRGVRRYVFPAKPAAKPTAKPGQGGGAAADVSSGSTLSDASAADASAVASLPKGERSAQKSSSS